MMPFPSACTVLGFFPGIGWPEYLIIGVVAVILFGKKLPEVGRSLGKAIVEFKRGVNEMRHEIDAAESVADKAAYARPIETASLETDAQTAPLPKRDEDVSSSSPHRA